MIDPRPDCPECGARLTRPAECDACGQLQDVEAVAEQTAANIAKAMKAELRNARHGGYILLTE